MLPQEIRKEPCLSTAQLSDIIPKLPKNVYVQQITIEACRVSKKDQKRPETTMFDTKQAYPSLYIPSQTLTFSTPLWQYAPRGTEANFWKNFLMEVDAVDGLCRDFDFRDKGLDLKDTLLRDRLYIKEILLLELPIDDPNYHDPPYHPVPSAEDAFYEGVRCAFATFAGTYQLVGEATAVEKDGWLPGATRKPMDLQLIEIVRTKQIRDALATGNWKAFHRGRDDIYIEGKEALVEHPERVGQWLPTLLKGGLIIWREVEGIWRPSKKFVASRVSLTRTLEEEGELEE